MFDVENCFILCVVFQLDQEEWHWYFIGLGELGDFSGCNVLSFEFLDYGLWWGVVRKIP